MGQTLTDAARVALVRVAVHALLEALHDLEGMKARTPFAPTRDSAKRHVAVANELLRESLSGERPSPQE